jgi:hypothetical protein
MALTRGSTAAANRSSRTTPGLAQRSMLHTEGSMAKGERPCYPLLVNVALSPPAVGHYAATMSDLLTE